MIYILIKTLLLEALDKHNENTNNNIMYNNSSANFSGDSFYNI